MNIKIFSPLGLFVFMFSFLNQASVNAAIMADYHFTSDSSASSDVEALTSAGDWEFGSFAGNNTSPQPEINAEEVQSTTGATGLTGADGDTLAEALANDAFYSFTLNTGGNTVSFSQLTFDHSFTNGAGTTSTIALFTSLTGFAEADQLADFTFTSITGDTAVVPRSLTLSSIGELQDFTSNVEFRFYLYDNSDTGSRVTHVDNVMLEGTAAVIPEPASLWLVLCGFIGFLTLKSRK
ncbi:hypothetical protein P3T73_17480 [Kiritimatiellota bacterium B12222]|nr:hypothetical protein P3T73_17480 [Kiritimatiellota bacterium B12222]